MIYLYLIALYMFLTGSTNDVSTAPPLKLMSPSTANGILCFLWVRLDCEERRWCSENKGGGGHAQIHNESMVQIVALFPL